MSEMNTEQMQPGESAPLAGVYACGVCGGEITCAEGDALPHCCEGAHFRLERTVEE